MESSRSISRTLAETEVSQTQLAFVGGRSEEIGIYRFAPLTGRLFYLGTQSTPEADPAFLAIRADGQRLYAADESWDGPGGLLSFMVHDKPLGEEGGPSALTPLNNVEVKDSPVHLTLDPTGRWLLAVSYATGQLMSFPLEADGKIGAEKSRIFAGKKAHQVVVLPSGRVLVPCLESQIIAQFDFKDGVFTPAKVASIKVKGKGPRHLALHPSQPWVYLINEHSSTIQAFTLSDQTLTPLGSELATIVSKVTNTGAEVQVHPSGRFVYASNRGDDSITLFRVMTNGELERTAITKSGGRVPRHFSIDPSGRWLLVANEGSSNVTTFSIDPQSGLLSQSEHQITFSNPQFVEVLPAVR